MNHNTDHISLFNYDIHKVIDITYPLLYLHGIVKSVGGSSISCGNGSISCQEHVDWPIKDGEFKVFVYLDEGKNKVYLCVHGENEVVVNVNYIKKTSCRYVLPIYIICKNSDGSFMAPLGVPNSTNDAITKIQLNARLMQTYFAESLHDHGFERKTFCYTEDEDKKPLVKIVNSEIDIEQIKEMTRDDLYESFQKELNNLLPEDPCRKLLCFMSCTRYNPPLDEKDFTVDKIQSYATGHAALGGGSMALFGTGSLHTWASHLSEVNAKFSDTAMIDRTKLFDDSCGRGTYMANYATTLGATVHELGHAFDLAHTRHGIMCRGHDDMNYFYTVAKPCTVTTEASKSGQDINDETCKYKGAHWYRSSAVILNFHKWFNPSPKSQESSSQISKLLHPNLLGPIGNAGPWCQKDQVSFNSQSWLDGTGLSLIGVVLYHNKYLCGLQFLGAKYEMISGLLQCSGEEQSSDIFGTTADATKNIFRFNESDENITKIKVRSGAYIDGIGIQTNKKCSGWLGGNGGDLSVYTIDNGRSIQACIGTAGTYVGSLGFVLNSPPNPSEEKDVISFASENGVRLIETYAGNGEVEFFKEYLDNPPPQMISVLTKHLFINETEKVSGMVFDNAGEKLSFSIDKLELKLVSEIK